MSLGLSEVNHYVNFKSVLPGEWSSRQGEAKKKKNQKFTHDKQGFYLW